MFELTWPWVLLLIPIPLVMRLIPPVTQELPIALKLPFYNGLKTAIFSHLRHELTSSSWLKFFCIWVLVTLALSGPRWVGAPQPLKRESYNIMMVLDISGSMEFNDMPVSGGVVTRLAVVKHAAVQFVKDRIGDRIGLILFGTRAYLQTPLTYDRHAVLMRINDATVGLAGTSTSIGDALGLAVKRLQGVPSQGRVIILLTDGVNNSGVLVPIKAAELAKNDGIKVYTIGLGSDEPMTGLASLFSNGSDLDEETLQQVATLTGGRYFRATDLSSLQTIYQTINQLEKVSQEDAVVRPEKAYYPWLLALALIVFFYQLFKIAFRFMVRRNA